MKTGKIVSRLFYLPSLPPFFLFFFPPVFYASHGRSPLDLGARLFFLIIGVSELLLSFAFDNDFRSPKRYVTLLFVLGARSRYFSSFCFFIACLKRQIVKAKVFTTCEQFIFRWPSRGLAALKNGQSERTEWVTLYVQ